MRIFAIADPHLSKAKAKPMDIFGGNWQGHPEIFFERWQEGVQDEDLVLIPGDISWAMRLEEAKLDLDDIGALKGTKVILRGNHDYWWSSIGKVRASLPPRMYALQHDALRFEGGMGAVVIAGTRGWLCPNSFDFSEQDEKIFRREVERLRLSLNAAEDLRQTGDSLVVMLHYPPTNLRLEPSPLTHLLLKASPDALIFGHLHGFNPQQAADKDGMRIIEELGTIAIHFVAADALAFRPKLIMEI
ncbi:MAG: metallophosphoesterase [Deinococcales bacterium]